MGTAPSSPLLYTIREKKGRRERTHTKPQPLSGVVEAKGCLEAKIIPLTLVVQPERGMVAPVVSANHRQQFSDPEPRASNAMGPCPWTCHTCFVKGSKYGSNHVLGPTTRQPAKSHPSWPQHKGSSHLIWGLRCQGEMK